MDRKTGSGLAFGFVLITVGAVLLLGRLDLVDLGTIWVYWPWLVVAWGLFRIVSAESPDRVGGGVTTLLFGVWFMVAESHWQGLSWSNSWPLAFVAMGAGMITKAALTRMWPAKPGEVRDERCL